MTTIESPVVDRLWSRIQEVEPKALRGKILFGGSVGDQTHRDEYHTYHESFQDQSHDGGYSVHYFGDAHPPRKLRTYACALDVTMHDPDLMMKYTHRLRRATNPNSRYNKHLIGLREFAGTLDGANVFSMDLARKPVVTTGFDDSHLWHIHMSFNRRLIMDERLLRIADVWATDFFKAA